MSEKDVTEGGRLARRTVITGALATAGGLVLTGSAQAGERRPAGGSGLLDVSDPEVRARGHRIRLKIDNTKAGARVDVEGAVPVPLSLGTSRAGTTLLTVTSTTGRTTLGTGSARARGASSVTVHASKGSEAVVFVTPTDYGPPSMPGDRLLVRGPDGEMTVDVWIEPTGGEWVPFGPNGNYLDLQICAVHAALMRKGTDGVEVLMFSPPRLRDAKHQPRRNPKWNPKHPNDTNQWLWNARTLNDLESRAVDIEKLQVYDREMKPHRFNVFCSGHAHTADGRLFVAGGHITEHASNGTHMFFYDPNTAEKPAGGWKTIDITMQQGRWYPVVITLPDGHLLIAGGAYRSLLEDAYWDAINNNYEVIDPDKGVRLNDPTKSPLIDVDAITDSTTGDGPDARLSTYPGLYVLPGEQDDQTVVALVETTRAWFYEYTPQKFLERKGSFYRMKTSGSRSYPHYGPMVLLPLTTDGKTARILALGGQHESTPVAEQRLLAPYQSTTATAEVLDIDMESHLHEQPGWRSVGELNQARFLCDATLLADGAVLVSGGSKQGWTDENVGWIYQSELFDPASETFAPAATAEVDRRYHSVALLLPDGSVLKAGSTGGFAPDDLKAKKWFRARMNAERYLPPYFWRDDRPTIEALTDTTILDGVATVRYGDEFGITTAGPSLKDATIRAALIRFGSMTHGNNMDQRYVWLKTSWKQAGTHATATVPVNPAAAPPGDYMLVIVDENDVPSKAKLVRVAKKTAPG